jgi:hypothetical protein
MADDVLTEKHLAAIGRVITEWAAVDRDILMWTIMFTVGPATYILAAETLAEEILIAGMESRVAMNLLKVIGRKKFPYHADTLDSLIDKLNKSGQQRNIFAHGVWREGRRAGLIRTTWLRTKGDELTREFSVESINRLACLIAERRKQLTEFFHARIAEGERK